MSTPTPPPAPEERNYARVEIDKIDGGFIATYYGPDGVAQSDHKTVPGALFRLSTDLSWEDFVDPAKLERPDE